MGSRWWRLCHPPQASPLSRWGPGKSPGRATPAGRAGADQPNPVGCLRKTGSVYFHVLREKYLRPLAGWVKQLNRVMLMALRVPVRPAGVPGPQLPGQRSAHGDDLDVRREVDTCRRLTFPAATPPAADDS